MLIRGKEGGGTLKNVDKNRLFDPFAIGVVLKTNLQFIDIIIQ